MKKGDEVNHEDDPARQGRRPLKPPDAGSALSRLGWAVVGMAVFVATARGLGLV